MSNRPAAHVNNLYNTAFWALILLPPLPPSAAGASLSPSTPVSSDPSSSTPSAPAPAPFPAASSLPSTSSSAASAAPPAGSQMTPADAHKVLQGSFSKDKHELLFVRGISYGRLGEREKKGSMLVREVRRPLFRPPPPLRGRLLTRRVAPARRPAGVDASPADTSARPRRAVDGRCRRRAAGSLDEPQAAAQEGPPSPAGPAVRRHERGGRRPSRRRHQGRLLARAAVAAGVRPCWRAACTHGTRLLLEMQTGMRIRGRGGRERVREMLQAPAEIYGKRPGERKEREEGLVGQQARRVKIVLGEMEGEGLRGRRGTTR